MEKKPRQEVLAEEAVFLRRKAMAFSGWGGLFCGEMELEKNDQDRGVWKKAGCDSEEAKSWATATGVIWGHGWVVQDLWCD